MKEKEIIINRYDSDAMQEQPVSDLRRRVDSHSSRRRRGARKPSSPKRQNGLISLCIILSIILITSIIVWGVSRIGFNSEDDPNILVDKPVDDKVSVLLVGTDGGGYNADTIMLAVMDCKNDTLNIMSIPRDTRIPNPYGGSGYAKINSVYAAKGMSGLIKQVGEITGLPINFYIKVDFAGFRKAIDTLGGVKFDVPIRLYYNDPEQNLHIDLYPGLQTLNGSQSEQLVRSRNQYAQADIKRTEIQREFMKELVKQHATTANLLKIKDLYNIMSDYATTNITLGDAVKYAPSLTKVNDENIKMHILPGTTSEGGVTSYWYYDAKQMETLANDVFGFNVKLKPTPRPVITPVSSPSASPNPTDSDDDDDDITTTSSPKPTSSSKPSQTPAPTKKPTASSTPTPTKKPASTPTAPQTSHFPGDYPDGI